MYVFTIVLSNITYEMKWDINGLHGQFYILRGHMLWLTHYNAYLSLKNGYYHSKQLRPW